MLCVARRASLACRKPLMLGVRSASSMRARPAPLVNGLQSRNCHDTTLRATPPSVNESSLTAAVPPLTAAIPTNGDESMINEAKNSNGNDNDKKDDSKPRENDDRRKGQTVWDWMWAAWLYSSAFFGTITFAAMVKLWCYESESAKILARIVVKKKLRKELFEINAPKTATAAYTLKRKEKEDCWKAFIYRSLLMNSGAITWIYGSKRIGKSTMLKAHTFELQTELRNGKVANCDEYEWLKRNKGSDFQVFYVNLEITSEQAAQTETYISELRDQLLENQKNGQMSLVVVDSIGALFTRLEVWEEDMEFEHFAKRIDGVKPWVIAFFRFVKAMADDNSASFVFVTSKPMHLVLDLPKIQAVLPWSMKVDIEKDEDWKNLSLHLTDQEITQVIIDKLPTSTNDSMVTEFQKALVTFSKDNKLQMNRIGHCTTAIDSLLKNSTWESKLSKFRLLDKETERKTVNLVWPSKYWWKQGGNTNERDSK